MARSRIPDEGERIRQLIVLEIRRIMEDLELRRAFLLDVWNRHRDRGPFLDTVFSRWDTLSFPDLIHLPPHEILLVDAFYRELNELRFFFKFTEMMPATLEETYSGSLVRLRTVAEQALIALGGVPAEVVIDFKGSPLNKALRGPQLVTVRRNEPDAEADTPLIRQVKDLLPDGVPDEDPPDDAA